MEFAPAQSLPEALLRGGPRPFGRGDWPLVAMETALFTEPGVPVVVRRLRSPAGVVVLCGSEVSTSRPPHNQLLTAALSPTQSLVPVGFSPNLGLIAISPEATQIYPGVELNLRATLRQIWERPQEGLD